MKDIAIWIAVMVLPLAIAYVIVHRKHERER